MSFAKVTPLPPRGSIHLLASHEEFEAMYSPGPDQAPLKEPVLIYFTASWCGACRGLDWDFITSEFPSLPVYKCDIDINKYTSGFCGVKAIPSMLMLYPGKRIVGPIQTSNTARLATWIHTTLKTS